MKITLVLIISLIAVAVCTPAREKTAVKQKNDRGSKCESICSSSEYKPVCGTDGKNFTLTFGNVCTMKKYNCEHNKNLTTKFEKECPDKSPVRLDV